MKGSWRALLIFVACTLAGEGTGALAQVTEKETKILDQGQLLAPSRTKCQKEQLRIEQLETALRKKTRELARLHQQLEQSPSQSSKATEKNTPAISVATATPKSTMRCNCETLRRQKAKVEDLLRKRNREIEMYNDENKKLEKKIQTLRQQVKAIPPAAELAEISQRIQKLAAENETLLQRLAGEEDAQQREDDDN